jgi:UDP-glucose 4-epimerase
MSRIVVFGADGFIGRHLVNRLSEVSDNSIVAFDKFSHYQLGSDHPFGKLSNVTVVPGDFFNRDDLVNVLNGGDYVFHLISTTNPATTNNDPLIDIDTNIRGSVELFEACVEQKVKKVIFFSSGGTVYGDIDSDQISELSTPAPRSPYGIGKLTIEHYLRYFKHRSGLDYIVYRAANPYGPGQNIHGKQGVVPVFLYHYLVKEPITIYGDGSMVRDYLFIDDLIAMVVDSYRQANKFPEYNLGSGSGKSVNELIKYIESCTGYSVDKKHVPAPQSFVNKIVLDISRFNNEFGIKPPVSLEDGIKRTWDYVQELK